MADEDQELKELKSLYDDMWKDARTMIIDMNRSIKVYFIAGMLLLFFGIWNIGVVGPMWQNIASGNAGLLDIIFAIMATFGIACMIIFGALLLYWYNQLRTRYARLIRMEKTTGD